MMNVCKRRDYFLDEGFFPEDYCESDIPKIVAAPNDVLCGRGVTTSKHPGNQLFRRLVEANQEFYKESVVGSYKRFLANSIISTIQSRGGRFINGKTMKIMCEKEVYLKTCQALRAPPPFVPLSSTRLSGDERSSLSEKTPKVDLVWSCNHQNVAPC